MHCTEIHQDLVCNTDIDREKEPQRGVENVLRCGPFSKAENKCLKGLKTPGMTSQHPAKRWVPVLGRVWGPLCLAFGQFQSHWPLLR